jgi:integrase
LCGFNSLKGSGRPLRVDFVSVSDSMNAISKRLGHRDPYTTAKIYQHALPDTDQDVAVAWDKLVAEKSAEKLPAQNGTNEQRETATKQ